MAQPRDGVICPHCGTRNKAKWEFCVRCGESIKDASTAAAAAPAPASAKAPTGRKVEAGEADEQPGGSRVLAVVAFVALVAGSITAWRYAQRKGPPPTPDPMAFTIPAKPTPTPPPPTPGPSEPGAQAYAEGLRLGRSGDVEAALPFFAQATAEAPANALYKHAYGAALWKAGQKDDALAAFAEAATMAPEAYRVDYAKMLDLAGKGALATAEFREILSGEPNQVDALVGLGLIYSRAKDYTKALPLLRQAAAAHPEDPEVVQALGVALDAKGDTAGAAAAYRTILEWHPEATELRARYAEMLMRQGKLDVAEAALRKGMDGQPATAVLERQLGAVLEKAGRKVEAARAYRAYARLQPDAADAKAVLSRADRLAPNEEPIEPES